MIAPDLTSAEDVRGNAAGNEVGGAADARPLTPRPDEPLQGGDVDSDFWLDLGGRISRWSASAEGLFGLGPAAALGRAFGELMAPEERRARTPESALACALELGCWSQSVDLTARDGSPLRAATSVTLVRTPNGLEIGYQVLTRAIASAPPVAREEVWRLLSMGRTAEDVAHELNNLLAALRGFARVLERHLPAEGPPREACKQMVQACDRGSHLTRKLLGMGAADDGALQALDLADVIGRVDPLLRQVLPEQVVLITSISAGLPRVTARSRDVELALLNLVVNARDAIASAGTVKVEARLEAGRLGAEPRVVLSVTDSGSGMSSEVRRRAFERFFTTKDPERGTGLGLSLVRDAVQSWGGSVELHSTEGVGTCVSMRLMLAEPVAIEDPRQASPTTGRHATQRARVIVVAPAPRRDLVSELLERRGYAVRSVDGEADWRAVLAAADGPIDVVVAGGFAGSDVGEGLVDALKELTGELPALIFFATPPRSTESLWSAYPACRVLQGPLLPEMLIEEIERSLTSRPVVRRVGSLH